MNVNGRADTEGAARMNEWRQMDTRRRTAAREAGLRRDTSRDIKKYARCAGDLAYKDGRKYVTEQNVRVAAGGVEGENKENARDPGLARIKIEVESERARA